MSDTQDTARGWHIQNKGNVIGPSARCEIVDECGDTIATMKGTSEQSYARARLIVAAQDILDRLGSSTRTLIAAPELPDDWPGENAVEAFTAIYEQWMKDRAREVPANYDAIARVGQ